LITDVICGIKVTGGGAQGCGGRGWGGVESVNFQSTLTCEIWFILWRKLLVLLGSSMISTVMTIYDGNMGFPDRYGWGWSP